MLAAEGAGVPLSWAATPWEELKTSQGRGKKKKAQNTCWFQIPGKNQSACAVLKAGPSTEQQRPLGAAAVDFRLAGQHPFRSIFSS